VRPFTYHVHIDHAIESLTPLFSLSP